MISFYVKNIFDKVFFYLISNRFASVFFFIKVVLSRSFFFFLKISVIPKRVILKKKIIFTEVNIVAHFVDN